MFTTCVGRLFDQLKFTRLGFLFTRNYLNRTKKSDRVNRKPKRVNFNLVEKSSDARCEHNSIIILGLSLLAA